MEVMSNLLMSGNNVFLKSISKVFQLLIYFDLKLTSCFSQAGPSLFFITPLQLSVNLMGVRSCR